jgi:phage portal protein BeeE
VTLDASLTKEQFDFTVEKYREQHEGPQNAGKALFLSGGADVKTVGQSFENMAMKATQGAGETRIAACAGVPPVIVGLSEGLSSATYSNYSQARRRLVDGTMRPLWGFFAGAMGSLLPVPSNSRLWYDDRDIPFLREDVKDQAEILAQNASTLAVLINGGMDPDAAVAAVAAGDLSTLKGQHSGLYSVQLQPPGSEQPTPAADKPATPQPSS